MNLYKHTIYVHMFEQIHSSPTPILDWIAAEQIETHKVHLKYIHVYVNIYIYIHIN